MPITQRDREIVFLRVLDGGTHQVFTKFHEVPTCVRK